MQSNKYCCKSLNLVYPDQLEEQAQLQFDKLSCQLQQMTQFVDKVKSVSKITSPIIIADQTNNNHTSTIGYTGILLVLCN